MGAIGASGTFFMQPASPSAHAQVQMRALAASQRAALHTTIPLQRDKKREEKLRFVADLYFRFCTGRPAPQSKAARGRSEARSAAADGTVDPPSAGDGGAAKSDNELRAPRRRRKSDPAMSPLSSPVGVEDSLFGRAAPSLPRSHSLSDLAAAAEMLAPEAEAAEDAEATVNAAADGDASTEVAAAGAGAKMAAAAAPAAPTGPREVWSHFSDEGANAKLHPELSRKPILISAPTAPRPELAPGDSDAAGAAVPPMMSASGAASLAAVVARNPGADGSTTAFFRPLSPQLMHAVDAEYGALSELDEVLIHALMRGRDVRSLAFLSVVHFFCLFISFVCCSFLLFVDSCLLSVVFCLLLFPPQARLCSLAAFRPAFGARNVYVVLLSAHNASSVPSLLCLRPPPAPSCFAQTLVIRQKGLCPLSLHSTIIATFLRAASMPPAPSALDLAAFADCTGGGLEAHTLLSTLGAASPRTVIVVATWEMAARVHADAMRFFSLAGYTQRSSAAGAGAGAVADAAADLSAIGASRAPRMRCCVLHARGSLHRQLHAIGLGCDVLIATPALLEEVVRHKILSLACAMLLVVLDTDWMMKNGHRDKLDAIVRARTAAAHCAARFGMRREQLSAPPTTMLPFESIGRQSAVVATAGSGADSSRTSRRGHSRTQNVHKRGNNFAAAATEWAKTHVLCEPVVVRADLMVNGATCEGGGPRGSKGESRGASGSGGAGGEVVGSGARGRGGAGSSSPRARFISKFVKINDTDEKAVALLDIIRDSCGSGRILIFFNSKAAVQKMLAHIAASGVQNEAFAIHGRMTPNQRDSAIAQFVAAPNAALLATEVVSRWVDTMPEVRRCTSLFSLARRSFSRVSPRPVFWPRSRLITIITRSRRLARPCRAHARTHATDSNHRELRHAHAH